MVGSNLDQAALRAQELIADGINYTDGALGCALSHFLLWHRLQRDASADGLEDDAVLAADFLATANDRLEALPEGWDIVLWAGISTAHWSSSSAGAVVASVYLDEPTTAVDLEAASAPACRSVSGGTGLRHLVLYDLSAGGSPTAGLLRAVASGRIADPGEFRHLGQLRCRPDDVDRLSSAAGVCRQCRRSRSHPITIVVVDDPVT